MADELAPAGRYALDRFGKNDEQKLRRYLLMLAAFLEGKPPNTKRTYKCGLRQFFELFEWICPEDVTPAHAAAFKKWLLERKQVSESTTYYRMSAVSSFFDFLCMPSGATEEPLLQSNPFKLVPRSDIAPTPFAKAKSMEWETLKMILDAIPPDEIGLRDKAILLFYAFTGRRRAEVAQLRVRDMDLKAQPPTYTVKTKGGRVETFELPEICSEAIGAYWIASDRLHRLTPNAGVFTASRSCPLTANLDPNRPLSNRMMNHILQRAVLRAGLDPEDDSMCIHAIRHMAARDLDKAGLRLQDIQSFLGHASPVTTQIYLDRLRGPRPAHTDSLMKVREQAAEMARGLRN